jgi:hypothetical protein
MKTLLAAATVATALLTGGSVTADVYADAELLATIENIQVSVQDDVKDGCLFNAGGIKARISATLERSGIAVSKTSYWFLFVSFSGHETRHGGARDGCLVIQRFQLLSYGPSNTFVLAAQGGRFSIGPDARDDSAMRNTEAFTDELITAILAARRSIGASVSGRQF